MNLIGLSHYTNVLDLWLRHVVDLLTIKVYFLANKVYLDLNSSNSSYGFVVVPRLCYK